MEIEQFKNGERRGCIAEITDWDEGGYGTAIYVVDRRNDPGIEEMVIEVGEDMRLRLSEAIKLLEQLKVAIAIAQGDPLPTQPPNDQGLAGAGISGDHRNEKRRVTERHGSTGITDGDTPKEPPAVSTDIGRQTRQVHVPNIGQGERKRRMGKKYQYRMKSWEYLAELDMNQLGNEGYRLVQVVPAEGAIGTHLVFEREIITDEIPEEVVEQVAKGIEAGHEFYSQVQADYADQVVQ